MLCAYALCIRAVHTLCACNPSLTSITCSIASSASCHAHRPPHQAALGYVIFHIYARRGGGLWGTSGDEVNGGGGGGGGGKAKDLSVEEGAPYGVVAETAAGQEREGHEREGTV
jgi:hypothetical protein